MSTVDTRTLELLHAYHDGELRGLARWRFERRLRREPGLRGELAGLERLGGWIRESAARAPEPDLWDGIARRLRTADAETEAGPALPSLGHWLRPLGAAAVAAAAIVAVWIGLPSAQPSGGVVRWMDSGGHNVMVMEADADVTIIWMLDRGTEGAARGGTREVV